MNRLGRISFMTLLPLLRRYLRRTERAYVMVTCDDEILLVKNWLSRQKWQLPGGGFKKSETSAEAAARELEEELNISVNPEMLRRLAEGSWQTDRLGFRYHIFLLRLDKKPPIKLLRPELISAEWLPIRDLKKGQTTDEVLEALRRHLI